MLKNNVKNLKKIYKKCIMLKMLTFEKVAYIIHLE